MAGEACFSILTTAIPTCTKQLSNSCSSPGYWKTSNAKLNTAPSARLVIVSATKSKSKSKPAVSTGFGKKSKKVSEDDAWESLFQQLEKDLENDTEDFGDEDITEEDVVKFERELDLVVRDLSGASSIDTADELDDAVRAHSKDMMEEFDECDDDDDDDNDDAEGDVNNDEDEENDEDFSDDDLEEPRKVSLERWQLKKLAAAAELGRRKVNIKSLAAELQLDRDDVLFFLKSPPPELLMIAHKVEEDTSEDEGEEDDDDADEETDESLVEKVSNVSQEGSATNDDSLFNGVKDTGKRNYGPRDWIKGKRLRKVNIATLERVYSRTKRPTNAMVQSLVQVTNLPRGRILEWFHERRLESGTKDPPKHASSSRKTWKKPVTHTFARLD